MMMSRLLLIIIIREKKKKKNSKSTGLYSIPIVFVLSKHIYLYERIEQLILSYHFSLSLSLSLFLFLSVYFYLSIASLILLNNENNFDYSMTNPIESNFNLTNFSIEKLSNDYFPNILQQDLLQFSSTPTLIETNQEQYSTQIKKKESRTKKNSKMEGKNQKIT